MDTHSTDVNDNDSVPIDTILSSTGSVFHSSSSIASSSSWTISSSSSTVTASVSLPPPSYPQPLTKDTIDIDVTNNNGASLAPLSISTSQVKEYISDTEEELVILSSPSKRNRKGNPKYETSETLETGSSRTKRNDEEDNTNTKRKGTNRGRSKTKDDGNEENTNVDDDNDNDADNTTTNETKKKVKLTTMKNGSSSSKNEEEEDKNDGDDDNDNNDDDLPVKTRGRGRNANDTTDWHCTICMQFHPNFHARVAGLKKQKEQQNANNSNKSNTDPQHSTSDTTDTTVSNTDTVMDTDTLNNNGTTISSILPSSSSSSSPSVLDTLLSCEGGCNRSYHAVCLGLSIEEFHTLQLLNEAWLCGDCRNNYDHVCSICNMKSDRPYIPYRIWGDVQYLLTCNAPDILTDIPSLLEEVLKMHPVESPSSMDNFFRSSTSSSTTTSSSSTTMNTPMTEKSGKKNSSSKITTIKLPTSSSSTTTTTPTTEPTAIHHSSSTTLSTTATAISPLSSTVPRKRGRQPGFSPKKKNDNNNNDSSTMLMDHPEETSIHLSSVVSSSSSTATTPSGIKRNETSTIATTTTTKRSVSLPSATKTATVTHTVSLFFSSAASQPSGNPLVTIKQPLSSIELVKQAILDNRIIMGDVDDLDNQHSNVPVVSSINDDEVTTTTTTVVVEGEKNRMENTSHTSSSSSTLSTAISSSSPSTATDIPIPSTIIIPTESSTSSTTANLPSKRRRNTLPTLPLDKTVVSTINLPESKLVTSTNNTPSLSVSASINNTPSLSSSKPSLSTVKALLARTIGGKKGSNAAKEDGLIYGTMAEEPLPPPYIPPLVAGSPSYLVGTPWKKVRKCSVRQCGKFYHYSCLRYLSDIAIADYYIRTAKQHHLPIPLFVPVTTPPIDIQYLQNIVKTTGGTYTVTVNTVLPTTNTKKGNTVGGNGNNKAKSKERSSETDGLTSPSSSLGPSVNSSTVTNSLIANSTVTLPSSGGGAKRGRPVGFKPKPKSTVLSSSATDTSTTTPSSSSSSSLSVSEAVPAPSVIPSTMEGETSTGMEITTDISSLSIPLTTTTTTIIASVPMKEETSNSTVTDTLTDTIIPTVSSSDPVPEILTIDTTVINSATDGTTVTTITAETIPDEIQPEQLAPPPPAKRKRTNNADKNESSEGKTPKGKRTPSAVAASSSSANVGALSLTTTHTNTQHSTVDISLPDTPPVDEDENDDDNDETMTNNGTDIPDEYENEASFMLKYPPSLPPLPLGFKALDPSHESLVLIEPIWLAPGINHQFICPRHICDSCEVGLGSVHSIVTSAKYQYSCALERIRRKLPLGKGLYLSITNPKEYNLSNSLFLFNPVMRETLRNALTNPDDIFRTVPRWNPYHEQIAILQGLYGIHNHHDPPTAITGYTDMVRNYNRYNVSIPQPPWWTVANLVQSSLKGKSSASSGKLWYIETTANDDDNGNNGNETVDNTPNIATTTPPTTTTATVPLLSSLPPAYQPKITLLSVFPSVPYRLSKAEVLQHWMHRTGKEFSTAFDTLSSPCTEQQSSLPSFVSPGGPTAIESIRNYKMSSPLDYIAYDILADTTPSFMPRKSSSVPSLTTGTTATIPVGNANNTTIATSTEVPTGNSSIFSTGSSSIVLSPSRSKIKPDNTLLPYNITPARDWMVVSTDRLVYAKKFLAKKFRAACMRCVRMYHEKKECMPPGCAFNMYTFLCPIHSCYPLPGETVDDVIAATGLSYSESALLMQADTHGNNSNNNPNILSVNDSSMDKDGDNEDDNVLLHHSFDHLSPQVLQLTTNTLVQKLRNLFIPPSHDISVRDITDRRHYRLPALYPLEVEEYERKNEKPPPFTYIRKNIYVVKVRPEYLESEVCTCAPIARANGIPLDGTYTGKICDEYCINRQLRVECYGGDKSILQKMQANSNKNKNDDTINNNNSNGGEDTAGPMTTTGGIITPKASTISSSSSYQRKTNCSIGGHCGNRALQLRNGPNLKVIATPGKGWGLIAEEMIHTGDFVIEYVGEIIDEAMQSQRLDEAKARGEYHAYMMQIDTNQVIDARFKANNARFINHSCDPNCELQRWQVEGYTRIGIFALRDIPKGEEITYDYQFFTMEETKCYCGTGKCRGYLGANVAQDKAREAERIRQEKINERKRKRNETLEKKKQQAISVAAANTTSSSSNHSNDTVTNLSSSTGNDDGTAGTGTVSDTEDETVMNSIEDRKKNSKEIFSIEPAGEDTNTTGDLMITSSNRTIVPVDEEEKSDTKDGMNVENE